MVAQLPLLIAVAALSLPLSPASAQVSRGDVNGDGVIDGVDALMVLQHAKGKLSLSTEQQARADVYPMPGTGSRIIGDGQVTIEDADRLLRHVLGLVSRAELTADLEGPYVSEIEPSSGGAGTRVTLRGMNFVPGKPTDNVVRFGGTTLQTLSATATELAVEIPAGAQTGAFTLTTPGGTTTSGEEFSVTETHSGTLAVPPGLDISRYTVATPYGTDVPDAQGNFSVPKANDALTLISAWPPEGDNRALLRIDTAALSGRQQPDSVDMLSTARSLVFLSPVFADRDRLKAEWVLAAMEGEPKVQALADVLTAAYGRTMEPLQDPAVEPALDEAVTAVMDYLSRQMAPQEARAAAARAVGDELSARVHNLDLITIDAGVERYDASKVRLRLQARYGEPLDWMVRIAEVDLESYPEWCNLADVQVRQDYAFAPGVDITSNIPGKAFFSAWDPLWLIAHFAGYVQRDIYLPADRDALYLVRAYNGSLSDGSDPGELAFLRDYPEDLPGGLREAHIATGVNVINVMRDLAALAGVKWSDSNAPLITSTTLWVINYVAKNPDKLGSVSGVLQLFVGAMGHLAGFPTRAAEPMPSRGISDFASRSWGLIKDVWGICKGPVKAVTGNPIYQTVVVFSSGGRIAEVFFALAGSAMVGHLSPMETAVVTVGNPWVKISEFPDRIWPGMEITLKGRFAPRAGDNTLTIGSVEAEIVSGTVSELRAKVPRVPPSTGTQYQVQTPRGSATAGPVAVLRLPVVQSMRPYRGFSIPDNPPPQFAGFPGTYVQLSGDDFDPAKDEVVFAGGAKAALMGNSSRMTLEFRVPKGAQTGQIEVRTPDGLVASSPVFTVVGEPKIKGITPVMAPAGSAARVTAVDLGSREGEVKLIIGGQEVLSSFRAPTLTAEVPRIAPGTVDVSVVTPGGVSTLPGGFLISPGLAEGSTLEVSTSADSSAADDALSLREAIALASTGSAGHPLTKGEKVFISPHEAVYDGDGNVTDYILTQPPGANRADYVSYRLAEEVTLQSPLPPLSGGFDRAGNLKLVGGGIEIASDSNIVTVTASNSPAAAACRVKGGQANQVTVNSTDCHTGLEIVDSSGTSAAVVNTKGGQHGMTIAGNSARNRTLVTTVVGPAQAGLWLHGAEVADNQINLNGIQEGKSHAVLIEDGANGNWIYRGSTGKNAGHAFYIRGGATYNSINGGDIVLLENGGDGVRIEGKGTDYNVVRSELHGNGGNGVTVNGGAVGTELYGTVGKNGGYGVLIEGGGTDSTSVVAVEASQNALGGIAILADAAGAPQNTEIRRNDRNYRTETLANTGPGILIRGAALGTVITDPFLVGDARGIVLEGADGVRITGAAISSKGAGVTAQAGTKNLYLQGGTVKSQDEDGILFSGASSMTVHEVTVNQCGRSGIVLRECERCQLSGSDATRGRVLSCKGDGIRVENGSRLTTLVALEILLNTGSGLVVSGGPLWSQDTSVVGCKVARNKGDGVRVEPNATKVYLGYSTERPNLVSGNSGWGVHVAGAGLAGPPAWPGEMAVVLQNNLIGSMPELGEASPNAAGGILLGPGSNHIWIGGELDASANTVSGNTGPGIQVEGQATSEIDIHGNVIGLVPGSTDPRGNTDGIAVLQNATGVRIGTKKANLVCANTRHGIYLSSVAAPLIEGNHVGWALSGTLARGNAGDGILLENVSGGQVRGNYLLGNQGAGIRVAGTAGGNLLSGNVVVQSGQHGVALAAESRGTTVRGGSIFANGQGGISSASPAAPKVTLVRPDRVLGEVPDSVPSGSLIQIYADAGSQGMRYLGETRARGKAWRLPLQVPSGLNITATVTDHQGSTSAFGGLAPPTVPLQGAQLLAYGSTRDGNPEIYIQSPRGRMPTRLTSHPAADHSPVLSPDAGRVAFVSERDGNPEVWVLGVATVVESWGVELAPGGTTRLTSHPAPDYDPAWSPDGQRLLFASERDGDPEVYVMNADGTGVVRLTNSPGTDRYPAWSPDGTKIAFTSDRGGNPDVWVMNADGSTPTRLTDHGSADYDPAWSPDGAKLAFVSERDGNPEVYLMDANGANVTRLTEAPGADVEPAWSPDGQWVAFASAQAGDAEIFARSVAAGRIERLTVSLGVNLQPSWGGPAETRARMAAK